MKKTLTLSIAAAALVAGGVAYAQDGDRSQRGRAMTQEQATAMADRAFERMDANKDGKLDEADREAQQREMFDRMDTDGNGQVSFAEFQQVRGERMEKREQRADARGDKGDRGMRGHRGMRGPGGPDMAKAADTNNDGAVSQAEFRTAALARFAEADANKDGTVTPDERRAMRGHDMPRRGPAG